MGEDTILNYNMLKILICIVQQNASYPQMYPQKILLPIFALLMAWPLHNIRGDFRQGEGLFFEVAPCCHHRSHPPYPGSQEDRNPFRPLPQGWGVTVPMLPPGVALHLLPFLPGRDSVPRLPQNSSSPSSKKGRPAGERVFHNLLEL